MKTKHYLLGLFLAVTFLLGTNVHADIVFSYQQDDPEIADLDWVQVSLGYKDHWQTGKDNPITLLGGDAGEVVFSTTLADLGFTSLSYIRINGFFQDLQNYYLLNGIAVTTSLDDINDGNLITEAGIAYLGTGYVIVPEGGDTLSELFIRLTMGEPMGNFPYWEYTVTFYGSNETTVPEPATLAIIGVGLVGLGLARRRRK